MPDVEVDRSCAGNAFAAAKRPRVGFGSGTKAWDGLSKPSAVLHDIFIDLLRSGLSVCSGSTLMAVVQRRCVGMDSRGVAVVGRRIADLVERLHDSMLSAATEAAAPRRRGMAAARGDRREAAAPPAGAASGASAASAADSRQRADARRARDSEEEDDAAGGDPGSDSENSTNSEETADTEEAGFEEDFAAAEAEQPPAPRRPAAVPVLPRGGGLALKVGAPALPLLQMLLQQVAVLHAAMVDWEARHAFLHAKAPGSHPHESSAAAPTPRT
ncbi:hypothetical protein FNF31_07669 [Cafeteria roenbergensis]|nr:hypothetical protein FNF31_07669 [Cafeteria roenbergensis]